MTDQNVGTEPTTDQTSDHTTDHTTDHTPAEPEVLEERRGTMAIVVLLVALAAMVILRPSILVTVAIIGGLVLTIMLHEAGHFLAAKATGMKATEFFLGFGPRVWSFRRGETEYGVKAIPAGGYVKIVGMNNMDEVPPQDEARTYRQSTYPRKMLVVLAGVMVNLVIAYVLLFGVLVGNGRITGLNTTVNAVSADSPAHTAGFQNGDRLVAIDGTSITNWDDVPNYVRPRAGQPMVFTVERDGQQVDLTVTPQARSATDSTGMVGLAPGYVFERLTPVAAVTGAARSMYDGTLATVDALARLVSPSGLRAYSDNFTNSGATSSAITNERPRSVIGIVNIGGQIVNGDIWMLLTLLASINLFLALFNLIPLLPFDGGHAAIATYERIASAVRHRKVVVDVRRLVPLTALVFVLLAALGLSTMFLDIRELITGS